MRNTKRFSKVKELFPIPRLLPFIAVIGFLIPFQGHTQNPILTPFEDWFLTTGTQNTFQHPVTKNVPGTTNVVVGSSTINSNGNYDFLLQEINSSGAVVWSAQYDGVGHGNDVLGNIIVTPNGEVYACGTYFKNTTDSSNAIVVKYSPSGAYRWYNEYNGTGSRNDGYASLLVSGSSVVAVGSCWGTSTQYDMLCRRIDTAGTTVWTSTPYDNAGLADGAVSLATRSGAIYVTGGSQTSSTAYKIATWKVNPSTGAYSTPTFSSSSSISIDKVNDVETDASGNVYVAGTVYNGTTGFDMKLFKYDASLSQLWSATWNGTANLDDGVTGLAIDANNNVIVTGYTTTTSQGKNYETVKYNSAGLQIWAQTFDGGINANDSASAIAVRDTNSIFVTGYSFNGTTNDYRTIRYDASGTRKWVEEFNSVQNANDIATAIAIDTVGAIIVTGQNTISPTNRIYTTVRYIEKNTLLPQDTATASNSYLFTKNNGQLIGTDSAGHSEVKFYTIHQMPQMFFMDTCVSYGLLKIDTANHANDSMIRVDMKFVGANSGLRIRPMYEQTAVNNFYCPERGGSYERVNDYSQLVSFNVWNGIDVVYGSNLAGFKYYFMCKPISGGGSSYQIDLKYQGADSVKVDGSGNLIIYTKLGNIVQPKAAAWELDGSGNFYSLGWQPSYQIVGTNEVKFTSLGSYNTAHTLVIAVSRGNPTIQSVSHLDWSTYYGGNYYDYLQKLDVNPSNGDILVAGQTYSSNFPVTTSVTFSGGIDAVVGRFTSGGVRIFSTFYGTSSNVVSVQSCQTGAIGPNGHYYIAGNSDYQSVSIRFPSTQPAGAFVDQSFNGGNSDGFIAEFDNSGGLVWSTYYGGGGSSSEFIYDMEFDTSGNLYCVMTADSLTPTTTLAGAYNNTSNLGGMILKFGSNRAIKWATNFGTTIGTTTCLALNGNVLYVGGTAGAGLPIRNPGFPAYIDSTLGGASDAYVAKFNASDSLIWCTYFGGNVGDYPSSMSATISDLYVAGLTTSNDSFPWHYAGGTAYIDSTYGGLGDDFFAHFKNDGYLLWATYYGGSNKEINFTRVTQDQHGNPYFMGQTSSTDLDYKMTPYAYADSIIGNPSWPDEYFATFDQFDALKWSTYFGGQHDEGGPRAFGIGVYSDSLLFFCGSTWTPQSDNPPFPIQALTGAYNNGFWPAGFVSGHIGRFTVSPTVFVGMNEYYYAQSSGSLSVYPNPSDGQFTVTVNSDAKEKKLEIYNSIGQVLKTVELNSDLTSQTISLNLDEYATGVYFVVLHENTGVVSTKIIKQ